MMWDRFGCKTWSY